MGIRFVGPRAGGPIVPEPQRADDVRALLRQGGQRQLGGVTVRTSPPRGGLPAAARGAHVFGPQGRAVQHTSSLRTGNASTGGAVQAVVKTMG
jgi:hypothetical protein